MSSQFVNQEKKIRKNWVKMMTTLKLIVMMADLK